MSEESMNDKNATDDFDQACRAFLLFSRSERMKAVREFASLRFPKAEDRFFEAVYRVITKQTEHS